MIVDDWDWNLNNSYQGRILKDNEDYNRLTFNIMCDTKIKEIENRLKKI